MTTSNSPAPEEDSIRDAALSELRHNLRTPVNHILGYTEMLIEDAAQADRPEALAELRSIHAAAGEILGHIGGALANRTEVSAQELEALCEALRPVIERVLRSAEGLRGAALSAGWSQDLERVAAAARSLIGMLGDAGPPAADAEVSSPAAEQPPPAEPGVRARLLVVDDNQTNRHMLTRRLQRQGYDVEEARDGVEALERIGREEFDLVLLDIMMPEMDGFEVLERLKGNPRRRNTPVIVISALDEMASAVRCIEMGAEDYLFKPFDPVLLRARINASLEKRRLRSELLLQEKLASLGALTAGIAHEIKNPLNFVTNFAELSLDLAREDREKLRALAAQIPAADLAELDGMAADLEQNIGKIREHGTRANNIISSMLLHSRGQSGERRPTDINALVNEYVQLAYHGARASDPAFHVEILTDYDPRAGVVTVVPQDLSRVFLNVASNALYALRRRAAMGEQGYRPELRVRTQSLGERVEVLIRDNGTGIPKHIRDRIFDPFFTTKAAGEGTGLGLSISREIVVVEHEGEMRVESEEGVYTEFSIVLPRAGANP